MLSLTCEDERNCRRLFVFNSIVQCSLETVIVRFLTAYGECSMLMFRTAAGQRVREVKKISLISDLGIGFQVSLQSWLIMSRKDEQLGRCYNVLVDAIGI
jgi:hypothetical protein